MAATAALDLTEAMRLEQHTMPTGARRAAALAAAVAALGLLSPLAAAGGGTVTTTKPAAKPPFFQGKAPASPAPTVHFPVTLGSTDAGLPESWMPTAAMKRLTDDIEGWLERSNLSRRLSSAAAPKDAVPPVVYLGCSLDLTGECVDDPRENVLATTGGNRAWRSFLAETARQAQAGYALVLRLELAPHWIHQRNLKGTKEVRLGTDHAQRVPWLTSLDTPVWVLQLTGAIVDAEGKVLRSGGEGVWAVRTPFRASVLQAQKLLSEDDVEFVRTELRRDDLPGNPLVWETAIQQLVNQLIGPDARR